MQKLLKTGRNCSGERQVSFAGVVHGGKSHESGFQTEVGICRQSGLKGSNRNKVPKAERPYKVTVS